MEDEVTAQDLLKATLEWRQAVRVAEAALAKAADVHQGIEDGNTKRELRNVLALELKVKEARDRFDALFQAYMRVL